MFLSLNVHEALTFETEICLHPDLFQSPGGAPNVSSSNASITLNNSNSNNNNAGIPSDASTLASGRHPASVTATKTPHNAPLQKPLQAGDFIEIRVWDGATTSSITGVSHSNRRSNDPSSLHSVNMAGGSSASVLLPARRQRAPSPPLHDTPSSVEASPSLGAAVTTDSESVASSTERQHNLTPLNLTPQPSPRLEASDKATLAPASLPPPFPRPRTSTYDAAATKRRSLRHSTSATNSHTHSPKQLQQPQLQAQLQAPRHVRDISDLSDVDWAKAPPAGSGGGGIAGNNTGGTTTPLDAAHQLVDLQVPLTTSTSDDRTDDPSQDATTNSLVDNDDATSAHHPYSSSHTLRLKFYILLNDASLTSLKPSARTQVSLLRQVADLYQLNSYDMVTVHRVTDQERVRQEMAADFCLITIKDQYLSRGDLHFFQQSLVGSFLYEGQRLHDTTTGIQAHAREIRRREGGTTGNEGVTPTGIMTEQTKIAYRSRSSRIFWLIQMSAELWDYSAPFADQDSRCEIYFDKFLAFCYQLFAKWKSVDVTHSLTVVFFSRTFLQANPLSASHQRTRKGDGSSTVQRDVYGRFYEDHIRLVLENETRADWDSLVLKIRQAFWKYPQEVGWNLHTDERGRWPSSAAQGNVLETINVTLNLLQYHFLDRDLHRTGNSIVLVSAGNGVFEVSKELSEITYQRMMDNGIGSDMLSLGLPPLHTAPFFMYVKQHQAVSADGVDTSEQYFEVPHWMHLSFVSYESDTQLPDETKVTGENSVEAQSKEQDGIQIGPDGFILRHSFTPQTQPPRAVKIKGGVRSPSNQRREIRQERQLITGRDFADILRASRPRFSSSLPRPFRTLLLIQGEHLSSTMNREESGTAHNSGEKGEIKEWISMESDDASDGSLRIRSRGVSLGQDPREAGASPVLVPKSPPRIDMLDLLDRTGSPSSSYTTQISGGFLGSSLERQQEFLNRSNHSPNLSGMQLQRTRSLEFDDDNEESGARPPFALGGDDDDDATVDDYDLNQMLDSVKAIMRQTDANSAKVGSPKITPQPNIESSRHSSTESSTGRPIRAANLSKSPNFVARTLSSKQIPPQNQGPVVAGGIGAALSQYRGSATSLSSETDGSTSIARVSSYGRLSNSALLRIPEIMKAAMSPLLLPPTLPRGNDAASDGSLPENQASGMEHRAPGTSRVGSMDGSYLRPVRVRHQDPTSAKDRRLRGLLATSPPKTSGINLSGLPLKRTSSHKGSKKKKAFNPFRQQDEDAVLAEKSHNRRRWSHVFPATEVEFKRHAGPNWKSLSAPAILPISVDYFPPQTIIDLNFTISQYSINISDFEHHNFSSTKLLLLEMVRQRITQDFQLVPRSNVNASNYRKEWLSRQFVFNERPTSINDVDAGDPLRMFLSMGHRLQVLSYVPSADTVHVTQYTEKKSSGEGASYKYSYMSFSQETGTFVKNVQSFQMYSSPYNWNKIDRILSGDSDRELREGMRYKNQMFVLIPDDLSTTDAEEKYVAKFQRLLDYFGKLRPKEESVVPLNVRIVTSEQRNDDEQGNPFESTPGIEGKSMVRFYVPLRKGRVDRSVDQFEYTEISLDATFNTAWTYRIIVNWLSASTTKIEQQIQSLQRRCTQFGLSVIAAPQLSVTRNVFLNPFRAPTLLSLRDRFQVPMLYTGLVSRGYVYDGAFSTDAVSIAECIEGGSDFKFRRFGKLPLGRQFVHRTGALFVRIVVDKQGWALIVGLANYRLIGQKKRTQEEGSAKVLELTDLVQSLTK